MPLNVSKKIQADQTYQGWLTDAIKSVYSGTLEIAKKLGNDFVVSTLALGGRTNICLALECQQGLNKVYTQLLRQRWELTRLICAASERKGIGLVPPA